MSRFVLITRHPADCVELQELITPCGLTLRPYPVLRLEDVVDDSGWEAAALRKPPEGRLVAHTAPVEQEPLAKRRVGAGRAGPGPGRAVKQCVSRIER